MRAAAETMNGVDGASELFSLCMKADPRGSCGAMNNADRIKDILRTNPGLVKARSTDDKTPLHVAAETKTNRKSIATVNTLLEMGAETTYTAANGKLVKIVDQSIQPYHKKSIQEHAKPKPPSPPPPQP